MNYAATRTTSAGQHLPVLLRRRPAGARGPHRRRPGHGNAVRRRSHGGRHRLDGTAATIADQAKAAAAAPPRRCRAREASRGGDRTGPPVHFLKPYRAEHTMKLTALLGLKADHGGVVPLGAAPQGGCCAAEHQVGGGGAGDRAGHRCVAPDVPDRDGRGRTRETRIRGRCRDHPGREANGCDLSFRSSAPCTGDAAQPPSREPDAGGRRDGARLRRRDAEQVRERHHPDNPVGGTFTSQQRQIYEWSCGRKLAAIAAIKPGVPYKDVHLLAAASFATISKGPAS